MPSATGPSREVGGDTAGTVVDLPPASGDGSGGPPAQITGFVGREREAAEVRRLLDRTRLITLTGPGGYGKTRLALAVAHALAAGETVWWVELAPLSGPSLVPQTVAGTLGVREAPGRGHVEALVDVLRERRALLVLDNCEHLISACAGLADALLRACPDLRIMATSRESLGIVGETAWRRGRKCSRSSRSPPAWTTPSGCFPPAVVRPHPGSTRAKSSPDTANWKSSGCATPAIFYASRSGRRPV